MKAVNQQKKHPRNEPVGLRGTGGVRLSKRERKLLELLSLGKGVKEIAAELRLARQTVHNLLTPLYRKMAVSNAPHAVAKAIQAGWLARMASRKK
jgi:DNA-binding CsgD family transcriptional regulator